MRLIDRLQRKPRLQNIGELGGDSLLSEPIFFICCIVVLLLLAILIVTRAPRTQFSSMNFEHTSTLWLKDLLEELLLNEGSICVALVWLPQIFFFVENFDESLRKLLTGALSVKMLVVCRTQTPLTTNSVGWVTSRFCLSVMSRTSNISCPAHQEVCRIFDEWGLWPNNRLEFVFFWVVIWISDLNCSLHSGINRTPVREGSFIKEPQFVDLGC